MFEKISFWPWIIARSCSLKIPKVIVDLTIIEFCKGSRLSHEAKVDHRGFGTLG